MITLQYTFSFILNEDVLYKKLFIACESNIKFKIKETTHINNIFNLINKY